MTDSLEQLDEFLLTVPASRIVQRDGIRFQGRRSTSPTLAPFVGVTVTIRYDPRDITEIRVFHRNISLCTAVNTEQQSETVSLEQIQAARNAHRRALRGQIRERIAVVEHPPAQEPSSPRNTVDSRSSPTPFASNRPSESASAPPASARRSRPAAPHTGTASDPSSSNGVLDPKATSRSTPLPTERAPSSPRRSTLVIGVSQQAEERCQNRAMRRCRSQPARLHTPSAAERARFVPLTVGNRPFVPARWTASGVSCPVTCSRLSAGRTGGRPPGGRRPAAGACATGGWGRRAPRRG